MFLFSHVSCGSEECASLGTGVFTTMQRSSEARLLSRYVVVVVAIVNNQKSRLILVNMVPGIVI